MDVCRPIFVVEKGFLVSYLGHVVLRFRSCFRSLVFFVQGYQRFPFSSKPVVGHNIASHAVPAYRASIPTKFHFQ